MMRSETNSSVGWWALAVMWFVMGHLVWTWPVWVSPANYLQGPLGDNAMMLWNLDWMKYAINHFSPGWWCPSMFAPNGFLFLYGSHTWLDGVFCWVASWVMPSGYNGLILWANLNLLFSTVATGLLVIAGLRAWGVRHWPLLMLGASAVAFSWFRSFALSGHYNLFGSHWVLASVVVLSYARAAWHDGELGRMRRLCMWAGVLLGVAALNDQTLAIFGLVLGALVLMCMRDTRSGATGWKREAARLGVIFYGSAALVAALHLGPIIYYAYRGQLSYYHVDKGLDRLVDASSLVMPNEHHFASGLVKGWRQAYGLGWSEGTYLGLIPLLFVLVCTWGALRFAVSRSERFRVPFYALLAGGMLLVLCLGDRLVIGNRVYFRLPGVLLKEVPLLNNLRVPQRWVWPAQLVFAVGSVWFIAEWCRGSGLPWKPRWRWGRMGFYFPLLLAVVPVLEGRWHPYAEPADFSPGSKVHPVELVQAIVENHAAGSILAMPAVEAAAEADILQVLVGHGHHFALGYVARGPVDLRGLPWKGSEWTAGAGAWLAEYNVTMVVFPFDEGKAEDFADWVKRAKEARPNLIVLNRKGERL